MRKIAVSGVTLSGNMGGVAMLRTAHTELRRRYPDARFLLLSIAPEADRREQQIEGVTIVPAPPLHLVAIYLPLAFLFWPIARHRWVRNFICRIPYFEALDEAEIVVDLCGIAFVDRRGIPLLLYNVACCLPAIVLGTPIAKLSQAMGPFRTALNRMTAAAVLKRCALVICRGETSAAELRDLGIKPAWTLPDVTFCLEVSDSRHQRAEQLLSEVGIEGNPVVVSPSEVAKRLAEHKGVDLIGELEQLIKRVVNDVPAVLILPHSFGKAGTKNNDLYICQELAARFVSVDKIVLLDNVRDPVLLRAIIGRAHLFIGCRFHAVASALAMRVPSLIIGWSHKYREMAAMFGADQWVVSATDFNAKLGFAYWLELERSREELSQKLSVMQPLVEAGARENFTLAAKLLDQRPC